MLSNNNSEYNQEKFISYLTNLLPEERKFIETNLNDFWEFLNKDLDGHPLQDKISELLMLDPWSINIPGFSSHTYDKKTIDGIKPDAQGIRLEPNSRQAFTQANLTKNQSIKELIERHIKKKAEKFYKSENKNAPAEPSAVSAQTEKNTAIQTPILNTSQSPMVIENNPILANNLIEPKLINEFLFHQILSTQEAAQASLADKTHIPLYTNLQLIKIVECYPALGMDILKNSTLRAKLSTEEIFSIPYLDNKGYAKFRPKINIIEHLLNHHLEYNLPFNRVKIYFFNTLNHHLILSNELIEKLGIEFLEEHSKNLSFLASEEINQLLNYFPIANNLICSAEKNAIILKMFNENQLFLFFNTVREFSKTSIIDFFKIPLLSELFNKLVGENLWKLVDKSNQQDKPKLTHFIISNESLFEKFKSPFYILTLLNSLNFNELDLLNLTTNGINLSLSSILIDEVPNDLFAAYVKLSLKFTNCGSEKIIEKLKNPAFLATLPIADILWLATAYKALYITISHTILNGISEINQPFNIYQLIFFKEHISFSVNEQKILQNQINILFAKLIEGQTLVQLQPTASLMPFFAISVIKAFKSRLEEIAKKIETEKSHFDKLDRTIVYEICKEQPEAATYLKTHYPNLINIFIETQQISLGFKTASTEKSSSELANVSKSSMFTNKNKEPKPEKNEVQNTKRWFQWGSKS